MSALQGIINVIQTEARAEEDKVPGAHARLLEATEKLRHKVETPGDALVRFRFQFEQLMCIRIIIENGVLSAICSRNGAPVTTDELARATKAEELLIHRVLRLLSAVGFLEEAGEKTYAANGVTELANTPGMTGGLKYFYDLHTNVGSKLIEQMRVGGGIHSFPEGPNERSPVQYAFDAKSYWDFISTDAERKRDFDIYMAKRNQQGIMPQWWEVYPAGAEFAKTILDPEKYPEAVTLVDVGGNRGHDIANFKKLYPELSGRFVLEDLPETIEEVKKLQAQDSDLSDIELLSYDFFTPQPVRGARAYFFGNTLHNCAMDGEYSRILIDDFVLPASSAGMRSASLDILMLFLGGLERTEAQWVSLLGSVGLEIVKVWTVGAPGEHEAIIEIKKKD
ncbi:MAG: hypothetical protein M1821_003908 [Bathelium mastoideum]|nr:MAG: hypothetical protein M1821_003908 [Bathelium mastoideum]